MQLGVYFTYVLILISLVVKKHIDADIASWININLKYVKDYNNCKTEDDHCQVKNSESLYWTR